ncbi:hypothetical protein [Gymnodinialimonas hymeniacidonis]|uniref:hypothetical protein n=1 Tax=Gymnodinialimonas hymeniacidonis TaxID=3126508 RepID=UPI0034C5EBFA
MGAVDFSVPPPASDRPRSGSLLTNTRKEPLHDTDKLIVIASFADRTAPGWPGARSG